MEQTVKEVLAQQLSIDVNTIKIESRLAEDLNLDSFGAVELAFALEDRFGFKISDDAVYTAKTVEDIIKYISNQISSK
ncbi:MAG: acyl carrier protein [Candidatus Omnitrophica bacterium]|nr:acyl carrier protein [Candidatus Omnitrophota bacterium]